MNDVPDRSDNLLLYQIAGRWLTPAPPSSCPFRRQEYPRRKACISSLNEQRVFYSNEFDGYLYIDRTDGHLSGNLQQKYSRLALDVRGKVGEKSLEFHDHHGREYSFVLNESLTNGIDYWSGMVESSGASAVTLFITPETRRLYESLQQALNPPETLNVV